MRIRVKQNTSENYSKSFLLGFGFLCHQSWKKEKKKKLKLNEHPFTTADQESAIRMKHNPGKVCSDFQGDKQNDSWIFALAIPLSSTFVYNSMGTINQQAMDQLQYPFGIQTTSKSEGRPIFKKQLTNYEPWWNKHKKYKKEFNGKGKIL